MNKFYITTAIAYTNAPPHLGHALELIQADVIARYHRLQHDDTYFLTGTDEHGTKNYRSAIAAGLEAQEFANEMADAFKELAKKLNISNDDFIRTTDRKRHWPAAQKIWKALADNGDLYKKAYKGLYCIGHEAFVKKSDLVDGLCPLHKTQPEEIEEENWFFKLTKYKKEIKKKIEKDELLILPGNRKPEILNLLDDAEDVSFSRPSKTLKWGIPVPGDEEQTMYVWADALTNYISALGYADNGELFQKFWPADVQLIGKDILRFHAMIWPAILMSAGLELPKAIYVHGFITVEGEKMSKTIGNVIDPMKLIEKYGSEVVRYFLLREIPSDEDGDFSDKKLVDRYNGDLANGLGNLVQRVATLIENNLDGELIYKTDLIDSESALAIDKVITKHKEHISNFKIHEALGDIFELVKYANGYIDDKKPWVIVKENQEDFIAIMTTLVTLIHNIGKSLHPFMPETSEKILSVFEIKLHKDPVDGYKFRIKKDGVLFPRLE